MRLRIINFNLVGYDFGFMVKRRTTILGLGVLAMGSGAAFTNASFENSASADADMRVLVEEQLIVEAGTAFRDGSQPDDDYDEDLDPTGGMFAGTNNSDFFDSDEPNGGSNEDLDELDPGDTPAMFVNDQQNGELAIKLATPLDDDEGGSPTYRFENALQVTNENIDEVEVGVKFETFGADTDGDQDENDGDIDEDNVFDVYQFEAGDNRISASGFDGVSSVESQEITDGGGVVLSAGETEQIDLIVDLDDSDTRGEIISASNASGNPFEGRFDTVQLVETLEFGTLDDSQGD